MKGCERNNRGSVSDCSHCRWAREKHGLDPAASRMKMYKQSGILILFGVTKAMEDDQVGYTLFSLLRNAANNM